MAWLVGASAPFLLEPQGVAPPLLPVPLDVRTYTDSVKRGCLQGKDAKQVYKDHARWPLPRSPEHRRTSTASSEESFKPECT